MFKWIFKPVRKVGQVNPEDIPPPLNIARKILAECDIDTICSDIVLSRTLLRLNTESIDQLFDSIVSGKDVYTQNQVAVALGIYFRGVRIPPSECISRIAAFIESSSKISSRVESDLNTLYEELKRAEAMNNKGEKL